jgi:putative copper resistance protein D
MIGALDLQTGQHAATVALNAAVALAAGASMASLWLARGFSHWASGHHARVRVAALSGALVALLADAVLLWLEAAAMAEVPVTQAGAATCSVLTATHYGLAWSIGTGALVAAAGLSITGMLGKRRRLTAALSLLALAVFLYTRSMVSHAAAEGDFSVAMLADWIHLNLISLWVGEVFVAGLIILTAKAQMQAADRCDRANYIQALSTSATFALVGIFLTGLFSAWRNLGGFANLIGNPYGETLLVKLTLVAFAAALGGINRFLVMPPLLDSERGDGWLSEAHARKFRLVLRVEAVVLFAVLFLAAVLSSTSPPTAAL